MLSPAARVIAGFTALGFVVLLYLQLSPTVSRPTAQGLSCGIGVVMAVLGGCAKQLEWNERKRRQRKASLAAPPVASDPVAKEHVPSEDEVG